MVDKGPIVLGADHQKLEKRIRETKNEFNLEDLENMAY